MTLHDILRVKGAEVYKTVPGATLESAVRDLVDYNCGSLVVCEDGDDGRMVGIITERDIMRATASPDTPLHETKVADVMTRNLATGQPDNSIAETMGLMTNRRIRHLPIVEAGKLVGMISIGDVVKAQYMELSAENHYLKNYIQG